VINDSVRKYRASLRSRKSKTNTYAGHLVDEELTANITHISPRGLVEITFSREIFTVPNLTMITNGTIIVDEDEGIVERVLRIEVLPGVASDIKYLDFEWEAVNQTSLKLFIQMTFDDPVYISAFTDPDILKITVIDVLMFSALDGHQIEPDHRVM